MLRIQKFGGSSLADLQRIHAVSAIVKKAREEGDVVAVVSAMGKTTNALLARAKALQENPEAQTLDILLTVGEQESAALLALSLQAQGVRAKAFTGWQAGILTDENHGNARIRAVASEALEQALREGIVPVVTGFQGVTAEGAITTLGRGGSDTTAVALAAALCADECEIYTDVEGIYTADPRLLPAAKRWDAIDTRDMLRLAMAGSQVLHPESVALALQHTVPLTLRSSFVRAQGTRVALLGEERAKLAGLSASDGEIHIVGAHAGAETLSQSVLLLAAHGIAVLSGAIADGEISLRVSPKDAEASLRLLHEHFFEQ